MPPQLTLKTVEFKLYPTRAQAATLTQWLKTACRLYNLCLAQRIKAYKRRKQSVSLYEQCGLLVSLRSRISSVRDLPSVFARAVCGAIATTRQLL